jgi:DNA-binding NarL/FixJ family response regulator
VTPRSAICSRTASKTRKALLNALLRLDEGESVIDPYLISQLIRHRRHVRDVDRLTERERAVHQLMAEGRSNVGIARQMYLSNKTVETLVSSLSTKLDRPPIDDDNRE